MEFVGDIKIEDLDPIGYKISLYTRRGSESPIVIMSDLPDNLFLEYIKEELRIRKLHKVKYFLTVKIPKEGSNTTPYIVKNRLYKTDVSAPPIFLKFKDKRIIVPYHSLGILIPVLSNTYWSAIVDETQDYRLEYRGNGSEYLKLYPKVNYGSDRVYNITLVSKNNKIVTNLEICLIGMRESYKHTEGTFILMDGKELLVIKDGILE